MRIFLSYPATVKLFVLDCFAYYAGGCRVPEEKCHMVLPEIEEEVEGSGTKLSLTSLLLGESV